MDLSKFAPHVAEAFRKFGEARYQDGLRDGKQAGRDEVMSGLNALRAFLPPATSAPPLPGLTSVGITPVMLSQPPVETAEGGRADARGGEGGDDEFDLDGLVRELAGADDPQVRQQVLALAWTAVVEAYKENGKDPAPVLARLMEMARGGAVEAATDPDAGVWLAWQRQSTKSGGVKAVWDATDGQNRKPLYGKSAESALRGQEKRGKQTEARARRDDLVAKLDPASGELFDEQDWDDFSGHLENLTGAELKELRQKIKTTLQDRVNRGLVKAGKNKQVRVQNLQDGVRNLIQHAIERDELPDAGLDENEGKISHLIGSMGGIRPDDQEFKGLTGFTPREAVENGILPRSAVKKNGKRFSDLVSAFKEDGHLYVQDQADGSAGDYDAALAEAILDGKKTANTDVYDSEKRWAEVMGRKSVAERLRLARLRRSDPAEFEKQKRTMMGEPEAAGEPDPDEYADYLNMQDDATADEQVPEAETPAAPEFDPASVFDEEPAEVPVEESAAESPVEQPADEPAEKPVAQMTAEERRLAEIERLVAESKVQEEEDFGGKKKKKKRPAQANPETPPAPAKAAQPAATPPVTPPDPVSARPQVEATPTASDPEAELTDEEWEKKFQEKVAAERQKQLEDLKQRREQLLADPKNKPPEKVAPKSQKVIERPTGRPLTEAEQERLDRAKATGVADDGLSEDDLARQRREEELDAAAPKASELVDDEAPDTRTAEEIAADDNKVSLEDIEGMGRTVEAAKKSEPPARKTPDEMWRDNVRKNKSAHDAVSKLISGKGSITIMDDEGLFDEGNPGARVTIGPRSVVRVKDGEVQVKPDKSKGRWVDLPPDYVQAVLDQTGGEVVADGEGVDAPFVEGGPKGKPGKPSLANKIDLPFAQRLAKGKGNSPTEAASKAAKAFARTKEVPPVPDVVRKAFANAPDKDELDGMWEQHVRQLAGEGGPGPKKYETTVPPQSEIRAQATPEAVDSGVEDNSQPTETPTPTSRTESVATESPSTTAPVPTPKSETVKPGAIGAANGTTVQSVKNLDPKVEVDVGKAYEKYTDKIYMNEVPNLQDAEIIAAHLNGTKPHPDDDPELRKLAGSFPGVTGKQVLAAFLKRLKSKANHTTQEGWKAQVATTYGDVRFTKAESQALGAYKGGGYEGLNTYLRTGTVPADIVPPSERDEFEREVKAAPAAIDAAFKKVPPLKEPINVGRVIVPTTTAAQEIYKQLKDGRLKAGSTITDPAYQSTTFGGVYNADDDKSGLRMTGGYQAQGVPAVHMNIRVPAGSKVIPDATFTGLSSEGEVILPRNATYTIKGVKTVGDTVVVDAEYSSPPPPVGNGSKKPDPKKK